MKFTLALMSSAFLVVACASKSTDSKKVDEPNGDKVGNVSQPPLNQDTARTTTNSPTSGGSTTTTPPATTSATTTANPVAGTNTTAAASMTKAPFDDFLMWRDGNGLNGVSGVFDYPEGYLVEQNRSVNGTFVVDPADGVFFVSANEGLRKPTDGASVSGEVMTDAIRSGTLAYPAREGRLFKLKFTQQSSVEMSHAEATKYCRDMGFRLPTIRELFDFCAAGTAPNQAGNYDKHRCSAKGIWSSSVYADDRMYAWEFGQFGYVHANFRFSKYLVRCVGR